ncbi:MAG: U32 family peptidase [Rhodospirillales bacterium]|jgi:O2-independent ubiquinone biosynthesis protein UbiV|nr:U32 family peptidase [Rhodospirillales bacterium]
MSNSSINLSSNISLGPVLYYWKPDVWRDFYYRMADEADVDTVFVGEVVCSKRRGVFAPHLTDVCERLRAGGKEVVLSTPALIMSADELAVVRELAQQTEYLVEANDMSACSMLSGRDHAIGPYINIYNEGTLLSLTDRGAKRICLTPELSRDSLAVLAAVSPAALEVQVFGRYPLALSARCYAARARGLSKDECRYVCAEDGDGLDVETLDGDAFLAVNGTQTLSAACGNLIAELDELRSLGIQGFRLSPHACDMVSIARTFRDVAEGRLDVAEGDARLTGLAPDMPFANGFFHGMEGAAFVGEAE